MGSWCSCDARSLHCIRRGEYTHCSNLRSSESTYLQEHVVPRHAAIRVLYRLGPHLLPSKSSSRCRGGCGFATPGARYYASRRYSHAGVTTPLCHQGNRGWIAPRHGVGDTHFARECTLLLQLAEGMRYTDVARRAAAIERPRVQLPTDTSASEQLTQTGERKQRRVHKGLCVGQPRGGQGSSRAQTH